jgi:hypothetical protein
VSHVVTTLQTTAPTLAGESTPLDTGQDGINLALTDQEILSAMRHFFGELDLQTLDTQGQANHAQLPPHPRDPASGHGVDRVVVDLNTALSCSSLYINHHTTTPAVQVPSFSSVAVSLATFHQLYSASMANPTSVFHGNQLYGAAAVAVTKTSTVSAHHVSSANTALISSTNPVFIGSTNPTLISSPNPALVAHRVSSVPSTPSAVTMQVPFSVSNGAVYSAQALVTQSSDVNMSSDAFQRDGDSTDVFKKNEVQPSVPGWFGKGLKVRRKRTL